jgi:hypothetical protein
VRMLSAAKVPATLHVVEKAGHIQAMFDEKSLELGIAFLNERLKTEKPAQAAK